jgi:diaminohydroxyphosphoribosylaminopyrimidine deaminase/5-amino-6-(5-phosphoribosylamino)uracil reductase
MARALGLARRSGGRAAPNPNVGALLLDPRSGRVLGEGFHLAPGLPHAEREALADAERRAADVRGAELVCTLEPCVHHGRTPPCAPVLVEAGIARVRIAMRDPDPRVAGRGAALLRQAGIEVLEGECAGPAARLLEGYARWIATGRPFVHLKVAMREDGTVHPGRGLPPGISSGESRALVHALRHASPAVLVGGATLRADDPRLTVRDAADGDRVPWQPRRVVLSGAFDVPPSARALRPDPDGPPPLVIGSHAAPAAASRRLEAEGVETARVPAAGGRLDLGAALDLLGDRGATSVLVEGGPALAGALLAADLVDRLTVIVAGAGGSGSAAAGPPDDRGAAAGSRPPAAGTRDAPEGPAPLRWIPPGGLPFRGAGLLQVEETRAGPDRVVTGLVPRPDASGGRGIDPAAAGSSSDAGPRPAPRRSR